ncbi:hypothetical protein F0562_014444 [Nyssa sinensis]|uniref:Cystatin domain-containing protein n=1 Tax=Nyssa sinensis TaxID=561372 RepID=A0A5J4ZR49_9ASTE|nr:hypothetical protein F0562_014444 [Nyssa sinensis]
MTVKSQYLLLVLPLLAIFFNVSAAVGGRKEALVGGWSPIENPKDPQVREIGEFAVNEHNKQAKTDLKFDSVVRGETQVVAGTNYRLIIAAKEGGVLNNYQAVVWDKPWQNTGFDIVVELLQQTQDSGLRRLCVSSRGTPALVGRASPVVVQRLSSSPPALPDKNMKGLFKSKPKTPVDLVRQTRDLLIYADSNSDTRESKREEKMLELSKLIRELKSILYGNSESEPVSEACAQLTQEFFRGNTLRLLIICVPKLNLEARKDATQIVANLQRQPVQSRLIACDYLEANMDLMDILILGYENPDMALHYGAMLRECIRHQSVARYVLESDHMKKFFDYIQLPNFDIAADAAATFKELLTRHKSTVAEFLSKNYDWFFAEYNSKLLESTNYITRRQAIKVGQSCWVYILLDRSNSAVMTRYVSSRDNLRILMNLLRESSKSIQIEAFHVFKLFAANQNKPPDVVGILVANRSKLLRLFADFKTDKEDEQFEADKAQVVKEIVSLEPKDRS